MALPRVSDSIFLECSLYYCQYLGPCFPFFAVFLLVFAVFLFNLDFICRKQGESTLAKPRIALLFKGCGRGIVSMVEQWSPKPEVKGSNPFSPDLFICLFSVWWSRIFCFSLVFLYKKTREKQKIRCFTNLYYTEHFLYTDLSLV